MVVCEGNALIENEYTYNKQLTSSNKCSAYVWAAEDEFIPLTAHGFRADRTSSTIY